MESSLSGLSSLKDDEQPLYVQPHYKECYRLAVYALLCGGKEAYEEFLRAEQISHLLSDEEILFILESAELPQVEEEEDPAEVKQAGEGQGPSTYFPTESDEEVPDLELGWPEVSLEGTDTNISLLFHPPRQDTPSIKEVVRKQIQEARQIIAIAMDVFTDVDIFKEIITATLRGVVVYILLDESNYKSFLKMSHGVGINIHDIKNIRVRTVQGQQYQCRSGAKFFGDMEQKFILVDCRTVLYGTYSYTWSYEKINLSMVLVITGQLVCSYDEEFRRLYARSTVPPLKSREWSSAHYSQSPNSSQLQLHMRSRGVQGMRGAQDDRFTNAGVMTRGVSMQDRLHQSHCPDVGNLVRGHSYGADLQKLNSMTRLRMGTKDIGASGTLDRNGSNLLGAGDMLSNRLSQQQLRHRTRYGADQNLIPFNSEMSLHRWKMDTYLNNGDMPLDASCDVLSPLTSPYSSLTGLNEHQSQVIHSRSRDIKSKMEEMRQKRLSLQDFNNLRQSQESLRPMFQMERPTFRSSLRGLDKSMTELEQNPQNGSSLEASNKRAVDVSTEGLLSDGSRTTSHYDLKTASDRRTMHTYSWHEPLSRTISAGDLDIKLNDPSLKLPHLQPGSMSFQQSRVMESLTEIPEEKEGLNTRVNSSDSTAFKDESDGNIPKDSSVKPTLPAESQHQAYIQSSCGSLGKVANSPGAPAPGAAPKATLSEAQVPANTPTTAASHLAPGAPNSHTDKGQTQSEETTLQRKNSMRMKVYSLLSSDDKKGSKKEEKPLQRKPSFRSKNPAGLVTDQTSDQTSKKGQSQTVARSENSFGTAETEKSKTPFLRLSTQRSSKKKMNLSTEQDRGSGSTLSDDSSTAQQRPKVYSRFEYLLNTETAPKDRSSSLNRHDPGAMYHTQSGTDNKLGRFMQRVGNLIGKNK